MTRFKKLAMSFSLTVLAVITLVACADSRNLVFGPAETHETKAYRATAIYAEMSGLVSSDETFKAADMAAFDAVLAYEKAALNGNATEEHRRDVEQKLRIYLAALAGKAGIKTVGLDLRSSLIRVARHMPDLGKGAINVRRRMLQLDKNNRSPTEDEWADLTALALSRHNSIQGVRNAEGH